MKPFIAIFALFFMAHLQLMQAQPYSMYDDMQPMSQPHSLQPHSRKKQTDIRNKNVNIIVNMDPKQVASELWSIMSDHLGSTNPQQAAMTINQIEAAISPVMMPSRRGGTVPAAQVAEDLENITRRLIINESPNIDPIKMELLIKEVSSDLLNSLQNIWTGVDLGISDIGKNVAVQEDDKMNVKNNNNDDYADLRVKIKKSDLSQIVLDL